MFNCQKTSAHQLLVKLHGQLLASHFVLNALLGEFSNIYSIHKSYMPAIQSAVQLLKTESEFKKLTPSKNPQSKRNLLPFLGISTKMANRKSYHKRYTRNQAMCKPTNTGTGQMNRRLLVHVISIPNITRYAVLSK